VYYVDLYTRQLAVLVFAYLADYQLNLSLCPSFTTRRLLAAARGATTAEKLRGGQDLGPNTGALLGSGGITLGHFFENSDAKSCILVSTCGEISCLLKTMAKNLGDQYIVGPQPVFPVHTVVALWRKRHQHQQRYTCVMHVHVHTQYVIAFASISISSCYCYRHP